MPKNVRVLQDGQEKILPKVTKIQTQLANGKRSYWIPEDEVPLGTLLVTTDGVYNPNLDSNGPFYGYSKVTVHGIGVVEMGELGEITITKNGTYIASSDSTGPFYGYSKVTVKVKTSGGESDGEGGKPTIPGKDGDGDDAVATTDDDGSIITKKLPSEIRVIAPPDILKYEDGQSIVFDGLLVKAFYPDGTEYSSIPTTDLIKPVKVASYSTQESGDYDKFAVHNILGLDTGQWPDPINVMTGYDRIAHTTNSDGSDAEYIIRRVKYRSAAMLVRTSSSGNLSLHTIAICDSNGNAGEEFNLEFDPLTSTYKLSDKSRPIIGSNTYTFNDKTVVFYSGAGNVESINDIVVHGSINYSNDVAPVTNQNQNVAWLLKYIGGYDGEETIDPSASFSQFVPIQWKRPGDAKILETSFSIIVNKPAGDNNTSGGNVTPGNQNIDVPQ